MKMSDLSNIYEDKNWKRMSVEEAQKKGYYPNHILWNEKTNQVAIVVKRSNPDFAINKRAMDVAISLIDSGDISNAYVVFREIDDKVIGFKTVKMVSSSIRSIDPLNGDHGPYYWIKFKKGASAGNPM